MNILDKIKETILPCKKRNTSFKKKSLSSEKNTKIYQKYSNSLEKTRKIFLKKMNELFINFHSVDDKFFEKLEEILIRADVGLKFSMKISKEIRQEVKLQNINEENIIKNLIINKLISSYKNGSKENTNELNIQKNNLTIILFVGVNGVGKTTSIGKLAAKLMSDGKKVFIAAADTFRDGAVDQLIIWGKKTGAKIIFRKSAKDPATVVFDAIDYSEKEKADILLIDTAGRLHNKNNLMKEIGKIKRIIQKKCPSGPHEVLLVLDATTGQNALLQAKEFQKVVSVTGLVLSKLDSSSRGGFVLGIRDDLLLPVKLVGLGEKVEDLAFFNENYFISSLFTSLVSK